MRAASSRRGRVGPPSRAFGRAPQRSATVLFSSVCFLVGFSARGLLQVRKQQSGDELRRGRTNPNLFMPAIPADDHHSAVNSHKTMQRLFAFALECYFPIVAFTSATHFDPAAIP